MSLLDVDAIAFDRVYPYENSYLTYLARLLTPVGERFHPTPRWNYAEMLRGDPELYGPIPFEPLTIDLADFRTRLVRHSWAAFSEAARARTGRDLRFYAEKLWGNGLDLLTDSGIDAAVINLVRDPRDIVCSVRATDAKRGFYGFGRTAGMSDEQYLAALVDTMDANLRSMRSVDPRHRSILVRYEDMVADPAGVAGALSDFLGVKIEAGREALSGSLFDQHATSRDARSSVGRWRHELSAAEIAVIEDVLGEHLEHYGYPLGAGRAADAPADASSGETPSAVESGAGGLDIVGTTPVIDRHRALLGELETAAQAALDADNLDAVLMLGHAAGEWAWFNHTGVFVSHVFEEVLREAGRRIVADLPPWSPPGSATPRVLHVLTQAIPVGGHTRLAWRWMATDRTRVHEVALTEQGAVQIPTPLVEAVDGRIHRIAGDSPAIRARRLAQRMAEYDLVVLHIHPFDAEAVAACGDPTRRPPTLLFNHADHVFWFGIGVADLVANERPSAEQLTLDRRGIEPGRCVRLPTPLPAAVRNLEREAASARLGIPAGSKVLVTMATAFKYSPVTEPSFMALSQRVLDARPDVHLVAVGPDPTASQWQPLLRAHPERVHLLGVLPEPSAVLEAADLYLDSFPFTSPTSLLESVLLETPAVSFDSPASAGPMGSDDYGVRSVRASSGDAWCQAVLDLLDDDEGRRQAGKEMCDAALRTHTPGHWEPQLLDAYAAVRHGAAALPGPVTAPLDALDSALVLLHERGGLLRDEQRLFATYGISRPRQG